MPATSHLHARRHGHDRVALSVPVLLLAACVLAAPAARAAGVPTCGGQPATITAADVGADGTIHGTAGDDVVIGSSGHDRIEASTGDDVICARGGSDRVYIDGGATQVWLGEGDDLLNAIPGTRGRQRAAGDGPDLVYAGPGDDLLKMVQTDDDLYAGDGADQVWAGCGADHARGGKGVDVIVDVGPGASAAGGAGGGDLVGPGSCWGDEGAVTDLSRLEIRHLPGQGGGVATLISFRRVRGGNHHDVIIGDIGNNRLSGGRGDDVLRGGAGADVLLGRQGSDVLRGNDGHDSAYGGEITETPPAVDTCTAEVERGCER